MSPVIRFAALVCAIVAVVSCSGPSSRNQFESGMDEPTLVAHLYPKGQMAGEGIVEDGVAVTLGPGEANCTDTTEFYWDRDGSLNAVGDSARVVVYLPQERNGVMVVVCPGGGYNELMYRSEGTYAAKILTSRGYCVAILCYRMPTGHHIIPLTDAQNAFRYLRFHAAEWGISKIGIMGMSAGGHLAATASTLYADAVTRPDFTVLFYPVISSDEGLRHKGSFRRLGIEDDDAMAERYSPEKNVTPDTPPALMLHSADDKVNPEHSICYYRALRAAGVEAGLVIFPSGGHGWGFNTMETAGRDKLEPWRPAFYSALFTFLDSQVE